MLLRILTLVLLVSVMALLSVGVITVFSTTYDTSGMELIEKQGIWIGLGGALCLAVVGVRLEFLARHANLLLLCVGLALAYLFAGVVVNKFLGEQAVEMMPFLAGGATKGSFRWLKYGSLRLQPSEFAKFALLLYLSVYYGTRSRAVVNSFVGGVLKPVLAGGSVLALIMLGKDLSTTVVTAVMFGGLMFCGGVRFRYLLLVLCVGLALAYLFAGVVVNKCLGEQAVEMMPFLAGGATKGSFRWLKYGSLRLQPSEFAKFALLLYLSVYYGTRSRAVVNSFVGGVLKPVLAGGSVLALIMLGKDLSTTVVTAVMFGGLMFCGGVRFRYLLLVLVLAIAGGTTMVLTSPERISRITSFQNAAATKDGDGYQLYLSQLALGGGGLEGRGFSRSLMKTGYLPEKHTDFILAIWGEEMGYWGMLGVLLCYFALLGSLFGIALLCRERTGTLICMGFGILVAMQSITNIGVISGWLPTTGVTAPFVSYGGSSMMSLLMCVGLVLNVCRRTMRSQLRHAVRGGGLPSFSEVGARVNGWH